MIFMRAGFYWSYPTRALTRGGQRTLLAIFALQLVGNMVNNALTNNIRAANGGDISVRSDFISMTARDVANIDALKQSGQITADTAVSENQVESNNSSGATQQYSLAAVDPQVFPLEAAAIEFVTPDNGSLASLLTGDNVVVTQSLLKTLGAQVGDPVDVHTQTRGVISAHISGVIKNTALFQGDEMLISLDTFQALSDTSNRPVTYTVVYVDVPGHSDATASTVKTAIQHLVPQATVTTTQDALQNAKDAVQNIRYFLQVIGLLALLISGIGIINTMQVLLRRRQTEIAMLKTAGYHRRDLYLLFGVEAGILGLVGGAVGAAAGTSVSFLVRGLVENALMFPVPTSIDPITVLSGLAVGFCTALIFGLLPIVQTSQIRPIAVLRGLSEHARSSIWVSLLLGLLLVALFFVLALSILQNVVVALGAVGGGGLFLLLLSLGFMLVALVIGKLPVPEHFSWGYGLLIVGELALSIVLIVEQPAFGLLVLALVLLGVLVIFAPRTWKATVKMALRNIGRKKARTSTTLVALFVGVFTIGLILTLSQSIHTAIQGFLSANTGYNAFIQASSNDKAAVDQELAMAAGVNQTTVYATATSMPVEINGVPLEQVLNSQGLSSQAAGDLSGVTGYDLANGQLPMETLLQGDHDSQLGSALTSADAGTTHVLLPQALSQGPLNLRLGDQITLAGPDGTTTATVTIAGFYQRSDLAFAPPILGDISLANTLTGGHPSYFYELILDH